MLGVTLGEGVSKKMHERLAEMFGDRLWKRSGEMLDPNLLQVCFMQASNTISRELEFVLASES